MLTDGAERVMEYIRRTSESGGKNSVTVPPPLGEASDVREAKRQEGGYRGKKKIWNRKREEGQRTALTEPGPSARQPAMMRPRLRPLTSARTLEGGLARDVIGGRAPGSTSDSSPFSLSTALLYSRPCPPSLAYLISSPVIPCLASLGWGSLGAQIQPAWLIPHLADHVKQRKCFLLNAARAHHSLLFFLTVSLHVLELSSMTAKIFICLFNAIPPKSRIVLTHSCMNFVHSTAY